MTSKRQTGALSEACCTGVSCAKATDEALMSSNDLVYGAGKRLTAGGRLGEQLASLSAETQTKSQHVRAKKMRHLEFPQMPRAPRVWKRSVRWGTGDREDLEFRERCE